MRRSSSPSRSFRRVLIPGLAVVAACIPTWVSADTIAYFRFEDGQPGDFLASYGVIDSAGINTFSGSPGNEAGPKYSADVPAAIVPQSHLPNKVSAIFEKNGDAYDCDPVASSLGKKVFTDFTIEAYVKFNRMDGYQTIIGRDDLGNPGQGGGPRALFYLSKSDKNFFRVELITITDTVLNVDSTFLVKENTWYHLAVVGNTTTKTLELFVDGVSVGSVPGFEGMLHPDPGTDWTIGRGQFAGRVVDNMFGNVDEVRFSDQALQPSQFLNAESK